MVKQPNRLRRVIRAMIGRTQRYTWSVGKWWRTAVTRDWSRRDYAFWDRARHCEAVGLELAGLFLKPLASKTASWVQGTPPRWVADSDPSQQALDDWWRRNMTDVLQAYEDAVGLGDCFVVINADDGFTVTVLPPDVVEPIIDENDYGVVIGWKVSEVHPHPTQPGQTMTIEDEYTAERRVRTKYKNGIQIDREEYPNLIGLVPLVHIPNRRGSNAMYGEPEGAALLTLLQRYNRVLDAALTGNEHQGRPTPTAEFESVAEMEAFINMARDTGLIQSTTVTHPDGETETYDVINFDSEKFLMLSGGKFDYKQPGSFASDTETLLGLLFYLMLQHTEIPEFAWGNAIASSKASAETQLAPFVKWIEKKRGECTGWMLDIARVALGYMALVERGVTAAGLAVTWEPLTEADDVLTLEAVKWAYAEGLLDQLTALNLLPVEVDDPQAVLNQAKQEADERRAEFEANIGRNSPSQFLDDERRAQEAAAEDDQERAA